MVKATSRTFIRSRLEDNPDLDDTDYRDKLEALPDELRRVYRDGDFTVGLRDSEWQVIPTSWILEAQERWRPDGRFASTMSALALDCAGGGKDPAVLSARFGLWFDELIEKSGEETADGTVMAGMVIQNRKNGAPIVIDVGGGYAGAVIERFKDNDIDFLKFDGTGKSRGKSVGSGLTFYNRRAEVYWRFREALDPDQEGGCKIALPPDSELRAELASPTWEYTKNGIQVESKVHLRKRLGRSTNKADAVVMCLSEGNKAMGRRVGGAGNVLKAVFGYSKAKHYRR